MPCGPHLADVERGCGLDPAARQEGNLTMRRLEDLRVKIFADGADLTGMLALARQPHIQGMTTTPTLMRQAGIADYEGFARNVLEQVTDKPISFEVFADSNNEMVRQGRMISTWASNVYVKIPVTSTDGASCSPVVTELSRDGVKL